MKTSRTSSIATIALGVPIWALNSYNIATGLRHMTVPDAVCAGMIFVFGPFTIWEAFRRSK